MPNPSVLFALFESYFTMRKATWNLVVTEDKVIIPDFKPEDDARIKLNICLDILKKISTAKKTAEWIEILTQLYIHEKDEAERFNKRYRVHKMFGTNEIEILLQAAREYIINQIKTDELFLTYRNTLSTKQIKLEQNHDTLTAHAEDHDAKEIEEAANKLSTVRIKKQALQEPENKLNEFFTSCISKHNAKPLGEASTENDIKDFMRNAENGNRPAKICMMLLNEANKALNQNIGIPAIKEQPLASILTEDPAIVFAGEIVDPFDSSPDKPSNAELPKKHSAVKETSSTNHGFFANNNNNDNNSPETKSSSKQSNRRGKNTKKETSRPRLSDQDTFPPLPKAKADPNPRTQPNVYYTRSQVKK